jgi:hypothetical protein
MKVQRAIAGYKTYLPWRNTSPEVGGNKYTNTCKGGENK